MNVPDAVGEVDAQKKVILSNTHAQKNKIATAILDFKTKFNTSITSLKTDISANTIISERIVSENDQKYKAFNERIVSLTKELETETKKSVEINNKISDP